MFVAWSVLVLFVGGLAWGLIELDAEVEAWDRAWGDVPGLNELQDAREEQAWRSFDRDRRAP